MNCSEFENFLQAQLDAEPTVPDSLTSDLEAHIAECEICRSAQAGYLVLRQAIAAWAPPPPASAESLNKLYQLRMPASVKVRRSSQVLRFAIPLATAAALAAIWAADPASTIRNRPIDGRALAIATVSAPGISTRRFDAALADATRATLDLAREASAPAGRIGREAMDLEEVALRIDIPAELSPAGDSAGAASGLIKTLGDRVGSGVKPLSGSARQAFSFLLGPETPNPPKNGGNF